MKISARFIKNISGSVLMLFLLAPIHALAQDDVVLIPIVSRAKPLKNVITVAKARGDFTDPVAAVNSISDASANNPYLVVIGPGVYTLTQTLVMKEHVDITGSGENVTKLVGAISGGSPMDASSAIISGANNAALSSLTVENTGGDYGSVALYNNNASPSVNNVTATASGGTNNCGVYNASSSPTMSNVTATASGGSYSYGVYNYNSSSPTMSNVTATVSGGTGENVGVYNYTSSSPTMSNVNATASGGTGQSIGVYNYVSSSPMMTNVTATATATGEELSIGVYCGSSDPTIIRRTTMEGDTNGLYITNATVTVSQSTIIGGVSTSGTKTCVACDNGTGTALLGDCTTTP